MAITLNRLAERYFKKAVTFGRITGTTSPTMLLYDVSRHWRSVLDSTTFQDTALPPWSEKESAVGDVIVSAVLYLQHIGCKDIEQLIKDAIERRASQIK